MIRKSYGPGHLLLLPDIDQDIEPCARYLNLHTFYTAFSSAWAQVRKVVASQASNVNKLGARLPAHALYSKVWS